MERLANIIPQFCFEGEYQGADMCTNGHINDTFILNFAQGTKNKKYVLQYINSSVFREPAKVMENIEAVITHLRAKISAAGGDLEREALRLITTKDGGNFYCSPTGEHWRAYDFIEGAQTYQIVENPIHFYHAGKAFGQFQQLLSDFPAHTLHETIVQFHDTKKRFNDFLRVVQKDQYDRVQDAREEISFILAREQDTAVIVDLIAAGEIPLRVIHNDTKFNNIMIDDQTGEGICVLDLDTVMPGTVLYDFGDAIRFGASTAAEDEADLNLVALDLDLFASFTEGYLEVARDFLTARELEYLAFSAKLLSLEVGIRFLTDYLNGDQYFKVGYPEHNLVRARTQLKLVAEIEAKTDEMERIINTILGAERRKVVG